MEFQRDSQGVIRFDAWTQIPWLTHGFTTRRSGDFTTLDSNGEQPPSSLDAGGMRLRTVRQIHSGRLLVMNEDQSYWRDGRPDADAMATSQPGYMLAVRTADCLPILLVDRTRKAVAAVHAGWRGTDQQIAAAAVEQMAAHFGSVPGSLEAIIGPGIEACCFQVGPEVAERFDPSVVVFPDANPDSRPHVDLVAANRQQLLQQGIPSSKVSAVARCTYCREDEFFSYRRDGERAGRMLSFIGIRP